MLLHFLTLIAIPTEVAVAVVPVELGGDAKSDSVSQIAVRSAVKPYWGLRLMNDEEVFAALGADDPVRACGPKPACLARALNQVHANLGILVIVNRLVNPPFLDVKLLDVARESVVASLPGKVESVLESEIERRVDAALNARGFQKSAEIIVEAEPRDSAVFLHPESGPADAIQLGTQTRVAPGTVRLTASRPGYEPTEKLVQTHPGELTKVHLELSESASLTSSPWFWVGAGAIVAGAAVAIILAVRPASSLCLCAQTDPAACSCD